MVGLLSAELLFLTERDGDGDGSDGVTEAAAAPLDGSDKSAVVIVMDDGVDGANGDAADFSIAFEVGDEVLEDDEHLNVGGGTASERVSMGFTVEVGSPFVVIDFAVDSRSE